MFAKNYPYLTENYPYLTENYPYLSFSYPYDSFAYADWAVFGRADPAPTQAEPAIFMPSVGAGSARPKTAAIVGETTALYRKSRQLFQRSLSSNIAGLSARAGDAEKAETLRFLYCSLSFKAAWSSYSFCSLTSSFIRRFVTFSVPGFP